MLEQLHGTDAVKANLANCNLGLVLVRVELVVCNVGRTECQALTEDKIREQIVEGLLEFDHFDIEEVSRPQVVLCDDVTEQLLNIGSILLVHTALAADLNDKLEVAFINQILEGVFVLNKLLQDSV